MWRKNVNVALEDYLYQGFYALIRFTEHVLHENFDLLMKFRKKKLLHDDAKIHTTSARFYNFL